MHLKKTAILLTLCLNSVAAKEFSMEELLNMSLNQLAQVSITGATLTDESLKTVPSAVTVYTHEQIQRMGVDYLHELLNLVPGFQSQRNAEWPQGYTYSSRGRRNGSQAKEILLLLDGRLMNDPRTGSANLTVVLLPLEQIERVEVIRGPGSALYGSNAYTGVINVISRRGVNELTLAAGGNHMGKASLLWTQQQETWQLDVFALAATDDGDRYNVQDSFSASRIETRDPRELQQFDASLRVADTRLSVQHRELEADNFYSIGTLANGFNFMRPVFDQLTLEQEQHWTPDWWSQFYAGITQARYEFSTQLTPPGFFDGSPPSNPVSADPLRGLADFRGSLLQLKWHNDWQLTDQASIQFGADWREEREDRSRAYTNFDLAQLAAGNLPVNYYGDFDQYSLTGTEATRQVRGAYGQYLQQLNAALHVTLGLRYDNYSDTGSHLSPRLGLVQQINDVHTVKLLYGEAFRAPALNETGLINNPALVGNTNLDHEIVKTWDLIWLGQWQETSLHLGWFQNQYEQPIIRDFIGATRTFVNGENETASGFELEVQQQFASHWLLAASLTYLNRLPDSAYQEADNFAALQINYAQAKWNANLLAVYHGEREMLANNTTPLPLQDYWLLNSKLQYQFSKHIQTHVQIKNLLDEDYLTPGESAFLSEGVPNRGREWALGVSYTF